MSLAYLVDAIDAIDSKQKSNAKLERARKKAHIRLWRGLREVCRLARTIPTVYGD